MEEIKLSKSKSGIPCHFVGGGAARNTYKFRVILTPKFELKKALYIKRAGPLSCSTEQAIVPVREGDLIFEVRGRKTEGDLDFDYSLLKIRSIKGDTAECEDVHGLINQLMDKMPQSVWDGGMSYHNRDGGYFCIPPEMRD